MAFEWRDDEIEECRVEAVEAAEAPDGFWCLWVCCRRRWCAPLFEPCEDRVPSVEVDLFDELERGDSPSDDVNDLLDDLDDDDSPPDESPAPPPPPSDAVDDLDDLDE